MLLAIWRRLAQRGAHVPKLAIIGKRGWSNDAVVGMIEQCEILRPHIMEVANLSNASVAKLIANACALLAPSFGEGYGLPLVEALDLGVPVVASDIAVFHQVGQEKAIYVDPADENAWLSWIDALADRRSAASRGRARPGGAFHVRHDGRLFRRP